VAPEGYDIATATTFTIDEEGKVTTEATVTEDGVILIEDAKTFDLRVDVTGNDGKPGTHIQLIQITEEGETIVEEWDWTDEPHIVKGLHARIPYVLRVTEAPNGYTVVAKEIPFTLDEEGKPDTDAPLTTDEDGNITVWVEEETTHTVKVSKVDIADGAELEGAKIVLTDEEGHEIDSWTSGKEPHEIEGLKAGVKYTLTETVAPEGYDIATATTFTLDETGKVTTTGSVTKDGIILIEDAKTAPTYTVKVNKVDKSTGTALSGARLQIKDASGTIIDQWTSDGNVRTIEGLKASETYTLHEATAPSGYDVASDTHFTIDVNGVISTKDGKLKDGVLLVQDAKTSSSSGSSSSGSGMRTGDEIPAYPFVLSGTGLAAIVAAILLNRKRRSKAK